MLQEIAHECTELNKNAHMHTFADSHGQYSYYGTKNRTIAEVNTSSVVNVTGCA